MALETTLVVHGVPRGEGAALSEALGECVREQGVEPALVGVVGGKPIVGMTEAELGTLLGADGVEKANTSNLGVLMHLGKHAATTVSATMELASAAGVRVFATGGLGGLHFGLAERPDVSADLAALARFPVAVVTSGVKSLLDVEGTRELLESLGVPVIGFRTDRFPAFYMRQSGARVDARIDDVDVLAGFVAGELSRTGRGVVIANPIPEEDEIERADWDRWLAQAQAAAHEGGRDVTPKVLAALHHFSHGRTLAANIALAKANAVLAGQICRSLPREPA